MAFLNLKKKEGSSEEVPDELPSLNKVEVKPAVDSKQEQKQDIAPDELPPIKSAGKIEVRQPPMMVESQSSTRIDLSVQHETGSLVGSEKLYFSKLLNKFQTKENQIAVEQEIVSSGSSEVMTQLKTQWEDEKNDEMLGLIEQKIVEKMQPMQLLEQEWRALRTEVDVKSRELQRREDDIKKNTDELKRLITEKNNLLTEITAKKERKGKISAVSNSKSKKKN